MNFQLGLHRLDSNMHVVCVSEFASGLKLSKFFMSADWTAGQGLSSEQEDAR
jgi:hypothetical protein